MIAPPTRHTMHRRRFLELAAGTTALAAGCLGGPGDEGTPTPTATRTDTAPQRTVTGEVDETIEILNFRFLPQKPEVDPGARVKWVNSHVIDHRVQSAAFTAAMADWSFDSGTLRDGDAVASTFEEPGLYGFFCGAHGEEQNCGVVVVGDVSLEEPLPCESGML